jgi:hypothetical protein
MPPETIEKRFSLSWFSAETEPFVHTTGKNG